MEVTTSLGSKDNECINLEEAKIAELAEQSESSDNLNNEQTDEITETDFFGEDISNVPNEKIVEDVEDIAQDLENLLGESEDYREKVNLSKDNNVGGKPHIEVNEFFLLNENERDSKEFCITHEEKKANENMNFHSLEINDHNIVLADTSAKIEIEAVSRHVDSYLSKKLNDVNQSIEASNLCYNNMSMIDTVEAETLQTTSKVSEVVGIDKLSPHHCDNSANENSGYRHDTLPETSSFAKSDEAEKLIGEIIQCASNNDTENFYFTCEQLDVHVSPAETSSDVTEATNIQKGIEQDVIEKSEENHEKSSKTISRQDSNIEIQEIPTEVENVPADIQEIPPEILVDIHGNTSKKKDLLEDPIEHKLTYDHGIMFCQNDAKTLKEVESGNKLILQAVCAPGSLGVIEQNFDSSEFKDNSQKKSNSQNFDETEKRSENIQIEGLVDTTGSSQGDGQTRCFVESEDNSNVNDQAKELLETEINSQSSVETTGNSQEDGQTKCFVELEDNSNVNDQVKELLENENNSQGLVNTTGSSQGDGQTRCFVESEDNSHVNDQAKELLEAAINSQSLVETTGNSQEDGQTKCFVELEDNSNVNYQAKELLETEINSQSSVGTTSNSQEDAQIRCFFVPENNSNVNDQAEELLETEINSQSLVETADSSQGDGQTRCFVESEDNSNAKDQAKEVFEIESEINSQENYFVERKDTSHITIQIGSSVETLEDPQKIDQTEINMELKDNSKIFNQTEGMSPDTEINPAEDIELVELFKSKEGSQEKHQIADFFDTKVGAQMETENCSQNNDQNEHLVETEDNSQKTDHRNVQSEDNLKKDDQAEVVPEAESNSQENLDDQAKELQENENYSQKCQIEDFVETKDNSQNNDQTRKYFQTASNFKENDQVGDLSEITTSFQENDRVEHFVEIVVDSQEKDKIDHSVKTDDFIKMEECTHLLEAGKSSEKNKAKKGSVLKAPNLNDETQFDSDFAPKSSNVEHFIGRKENTSNDVYSIVNEPATTKKSLNKQVTDPICIKLESPKAILVEAIEKENTSNEVDVASEEVELEKSKTAQLTETKSVNEQHFPADIRDIDNLSAENSKASFTNENIPNVEKMPETLLIDCKDGGNEIPEKCEEQIGFKQDDLLVSSKKIETAPIAQEIENIEPLADSLGGKSELSTFTTETVEEVFELDPPRSDVQSADNNLAQTYQFERDSDELKEIVGAISESENITVGINVEIQRAPDCQQLEESSVTDTTLVKIKDLSQPTSNKEIRSKTKSITYSKEIKEMFESEDATQSAVASILSNVIKPSVSDVNVQENNETTTQKSLESTSFQNEKDEMQEIRSPRASESLETVEESEPLETDTKSIAPQSSQLKFSIIPKEISLAESSSQEKTIQDTPLITPNEILQQPLKVKIEHVDRYAKNDDEIGIDNAVEVKNPLKITITKNKFDNKHSILKIYDPKEAQHSPATYVSETSSKASLLSDNEHGDGESFVPKITIKPIPSAEGDSEQRYTITSKSENEDNLNRHFTVETVESQSSPKLRIRSVCVDTCLNADFYKKSKPNERELVSPLKIFLKSKTEEVQSSKSTKRSKSPEDVPSHSSNSPKITIKPVRPPEEGEETVTRSQRQIHKSLLKVQEHSSKTSESHGRQSPRITIKPVLKPEDQESNKEPKPCPKITIKPITKPDSVINIEEKVTQASFSNVQESNQHDDDKAFTPRITIKSIKCENEPEHSENLSHTPRITIKPIINPEHAVGNQASDRKEETFSPKVTFKPLSKSEDKHTVTDDSANVNLITFDDKHRIERNAKNCAKSANKNFEEVGKEDRRQSPRFVNKLLLKCGEESRNLDSIDDTRYQNKLSVDPLQLLQERQGELGETSITPIITLKTLNKHETQTAGSSKLEEMLSIPKITIKPIIKQDESHNDEKTPKIVIKPIVKPLASSTNESTSFAKVSHAEEEYSESKRLKLAIPKREREETSVNDSPLVQSLKLSLKSASRDAEEIDLIDFEEQIKQERIILKINKNTIASPSRTSDKSEKLTRLKMKLSKEGGTKRTFTDNFDNETKKQKIEMGDVTISLIDSEDSQDNTDNLQNLKSDSDHHERDFTDSVQIIPLGLPEKVTEKNDTDPLEDIPVFEITPESAAAMKQAVHPKPGVSVVTFPTPNVPSPVQPQTPRKRGRPRKVPLEVREEFKDPVEETSQPVQIEYVSSRPKRSCRGQNVRNTLGIKPRRARGSGPRNRGTRGRRGRIANVRMDFDVQPIETKEPEPEPHQVEVVDIKPDITKEDQNEVNKDNCNIFSSTLISCTTSSTELSTSAPASLLESLIVQPLPPSQIVHEQLKSELYEEETRMSADNSRAQTPSKQTLFALPEAIVEESQSSIQSTATTESEKNKSRRVPKYEVHFEPEGEIISADKLAEYCWGGGGPFMLQEQVAQFLGIKSFKRKYPGIPRRPVDMQERDFIRESGLASEAMCDMGLTAVRSEDILDIMYTDFQPKYEEYCKHQRDRHAKDISNKQKAFNLAASQEKNKLDIVEQAIHSASAWNANFNRTRKEQRKGCMDLQTFTIHFPKGKLKLTKSSAQNYPVALVPGQFCDFYKIFSPSELSHLPLNTNTYKSPDHFVHETEDSQSDASGSDSGSSSSDSESSDSSSSIEDCKMCRRSSSSQKRNLT